MEPQKIVKKPWGEERWFALTAKYVGKILLINKGKRLSLQYHRKKDETFYLASGVLGVDYWRKGHKKKHIIMKKGDTLRIPPGTIHRTQAIKKCRIVEISTPEVNDIIRLDDDFGRIKK